MYSAGGFSVAQNVQLNVMNYSAKDTLILNCLILLLNYKGQLFFLMHARLRWFKYAYSRPFLAGDFYP